MAAVGVVACGLGLSCAGGSFACADDSVCAGGICAPPGYCAFDDGECGSGYRFGAHAGDGLAGQCLQPEGETGTFTGGLATSESGGSEAGTSVDSDGSTSNPVSASGSTSDPSATSDATTGIPGTCGNGQRDPNEDCDDGNAVDGDGCNIDCKPSGQRLWHSTFDGGGQDLDSARDLVWADGRIVVGGVVTMTDVGLMDVRVFEGDGSEVWSRQVDHVGGRNGVWGIDELEGKIVAAGEGATDSDPLGYMVAYDLDGNQLFVSVVNMEVFDLAIEADDATWLSGRASGDQARIAMWNDESAITWFDAGVFPASPSTAWDVAVREGQLVVPGQAASPSEAFIYAVDNDGTVAWSATPDIAVSEVSAAYGVALAQDGSIAVSGVWRPMDTDDGWVMVLSPDGSEVLWSSTFGTELGNDNVHKTAFAPDGTLVGVGWEATANGSSALWVGKWDTEGDLLWTDAVEGADSGSNSLWGVAVDDDGSIAVSGHIAVAGNYVDYYVARYSP